MTAARFNAITYSNRLKHAADKNEMADIQAEELANIINNDLATKRDLENTSSLLRQDLLNTKNEIVIKLGSMMIGCSAFISLTIAVVGFLLKR